MVDKQEHSSMVTQKATHEHTCTLFNHVETLWLHFKWRAQSRANVSTWFGVFGLLPVCCQRVRKRTQWEYMTLQAYPFPASCSKFPFHIRTHAHAVAQIGVTFVVLYLWSSLKEHKLAVTWKCALACERVYVCVSVGVCQAVWECLCVPLSSSWQSWCWAHSLATAAADGWESHFSLVPRTTFWVPELHNVFSHLHPLCWYQMTWCTAGTCVRLLFFFLLVFLQSSSPCLSLVLFFSSSLSLIELSN